MINKFLQGLLVLLFCSAFSVNAQKGVIKLNKKKLSAEDERNLDTAFVFLEEDNYLLALPYFQKLHQNHPEELYFKYRLGTCYLYKTDQHDLALKYFKEVYDENPKAIDIFYFLGRSYLLNYQFDDAISQFTQYLATKPPAARKKETVRYIENSNNGKIFVASPVKANIKNIGAPINTSASEYVPVISADQSVMIFTYRGERSMGGVQGKDGYFEDIMISYKVGNNWLTPEPIETINSYGHDATVALSSDGQKLFVYINTPENRGDLYMSKLEGEGWSYPQQLPGKVNSDNSWEGSVTLAPDEKTIYFSSDRSGGVGGKDLYKADLMPDGRWSNIENLGPTINTIYDDDAPFLHPNGKNMYFSSQGHSSMGGYDIFKSELNEDNTWTTPENMGYPINTTGDDIYFVLAADGTTGYYASGKEGGFGQQDIYILEIEQQIKPLILVKGNITLDNNPVEATVTVQEVGEDELVAELTSNISTGKYLVSFASGKDYVITYKLEGHDPVKETIAGTNLTKYSEKEINKNFLSAPVVAIETPVQTEPLEPEPLAPLEDIAEKKEEPVREPEPVTPEVVTVESISNKSVDGLIYRVQVAAYRKPQNYNFNHLIKVGKVEKINLNDGVTRFVIGDPFKTLNDAKEYNKKVKSAGQQDAFVTAIYQGKRIYLEELVKLNLPFK